MSKRKAGRRDFMRTSAMGAAGFSLAPSGSLLSLLSKKPKPSAGADKLKVVCVGGHPDDPESGCGGTLAKFATAGHEVVIIYLTRGEAGINGKSHDEAATIRSAEAMAACKIIGAKPVFAGQIDGNTIIDQEQLTHLMSMIAAESPDIVFTHWPIDSHKDHQVASLLTTQCWVHSGKKFQLYYFEVCAGNQTMQFQPTEFVDITDVQQVKRKAVECHVSQDPAGIYQSADCNHQLMEDFRGLQAGVKAAEGFVKMDAKMKM